MEIGLEDQLKSQDEGAGGKYSSIKRLSESGLTRRLNQPGQREIRAGEGRFFVSRCKGAEVSD